MAEGESHQHDESMYSIESWTKGWDEGQWGFHCNVINDLLIKYYERLVDDSGSQMRFFLPLCGKSLDMKWLADKGHRVVGIDCAPRAAVDFFAENQIEYTESEISNIENCTLYKSKDGKIEFYVCDYFALTKDVLKEFDVIWDRGSLNAMPKSKVSDYVELIKQFMKPGTKVLLDLFEVYDDNGEILKDITHLLEADVRRLYDNCQCEVLGTYKYADIAKDMCMDEGQEESFNKSVADQAGSEDQSENDSSEVDVFKNMIGRTYLLTVK
ncbi:probable thiopurine S-methyltransferase [Apostichopus japonicus]|uniref:probable thiopurine S-methyltransferase n=1 Tax=Stichopus japonicus TaxID=307972 RepID=UPI003AB6E2EF